MYSIINLNNWTTYKTEYYAIINSKTGKYYGIYMSLLLAQEAMKEIV